MKNRILFSVLALVAVTLFAQGKQKILSCSPVSRLR